MNETAKPRRPMVPGPGSVSERAIALREQKAGLTQRDDRAPPLMQSTDQGRSWVPVLPDNIGNIANAISGVMSEVGTIKKSGYNDYHKYHYAKMEDVLDALTPLMGKHGLAIFQNEIEIKMEGNNRIAVVYEFSVIHKSNERWPPVRHTGTAIARDSKGNFDDKAISKAHTQARKYFLLSLFQVPAGDFPDSDSDANGKEKKPVPGPKSESNIDQHQRTPQDPTKPHKIVMPAGSTADQWATAYLRTLGSAKSVAELTEWDKLNDDYLQRISDRYPEIYTTLTAAFDRRSADLSTPKQPALPDDTQEAMNWIATQLAAATTYEFAEQFWNQHVAPNEQKFDELDWELLMKEWERAETRLKAPDA